MNERKEKREKKGYTNLIERKKSVKGNVSKGRESGNSSPPV